MKTIDWKPLIEIFQRNIVSVHNKFQLLTNNQPLELDNLEQTYANLIQVAEEVALEQLPKKKRANKHQPNKSINVVEAREKLKNISLKYHKHPTQNKKITLIAAKGSFDDVYLNAEVDFINVRKQTSQINTSVKSIMLLRKPLKNYLGKIINQP